MVYLANPSDKEPSIIRAEVITSMPNNTHLHGESMEIRLDIHTPYPLNAAGVAFQAFNEFDFPVLHLWNFDSEIPFCREKGVYKLVCKLPKVRLYMGRYSLKIHFSLLSTGEKLETLENVCPFEVVMYGKNRDYNWAPNTCTYIEDCKWSVTTENLHLISQ
jgi:lipopolysaccharide transport system ATP-binding protein